MGRRILNDALRTIVNAERRGKASVELKPSSTVMSSFLRIMKEKEIKDVEMIGRYKVLELVMKKLLNQTDTAEFVVAFAGIQDAIHQFGEQKKLRNLRVP